MCVCVCLVQRTITSNLWPVSSDLWHWPTGGYREAGVGCSLAWQTADEGWSLAEFMTLKWERVTVVPCPCPLFYRHSNGDGRFRHSWASAEGSSRCRGKGKGDIWLCVTDPLIFSSFIFGGRNFHMKNHSKVINWLYNADSTAARSPGFLWKCGKMLFLNVRVWDKPLSIAYECPMQKICKAKTIISSVKTFPFKYQETISKLYYIQSIIVCKGS